MVIIEKIWPLQYLLKKFQIIINEKFCQLLLFCISVDQYYVGDGCTTSGTSVTGLFQSKYSTANVRCCSEDGSSCDTEGGHTCPDDAICFDDAVSQCESFGKRLCTKEELLSEICCGTGGSCDSYAVWTSTLYEGMKIII